jgi:hypothetical protein
MPKVYQAYYSDGKEGRWKTNNASRTLILVEARNAAKKYGVKVDVDVLEIEKPSFKYFVECMNGRQANSRTRLCSFIPKEQVRVQNENGSYETRWKVKKVV